MIRAKLDINGDPLTWAVCTRLMDGPDDGWNTYRCRALGVGQPFEVRHDRSEGAWALVATVAAKLAEAGVGRPQPSLFDVTQSEEGDGANPGA